MPTGYTAQIADGMTFEEFVMRCARAMGACIDLRDEPTSTPIPDRFEPSDYHLTKRTSAETGLARLSRMTMAEAEEAARSEFLAAQADHAAHMQKNDDLRQKYEEMLAKVRAWQPPTPDHIGMKKFMIEQLTSSIDFDCDNSYYRDRPPHRLSGPDWLATKMAAAQHDINYHTKEHAEEVERVERRNTWIASLRESLKKEPLK